MNPEFPKTSSPMPSDVSQLKIYSLGIVANNKAASSHTVQITPVETLTMLDGEVGSVVAETEVSGVDSKGEAYNSKVKSDTAIEADWFPGIGVTNRRTPPDVRRGEHVLIWQYADEDKYYWSSLGLDDTLRKLETVIYSWSGTSDEAVDGTQDGNCYSLELSTHTGQVTLKTSKANKEHCIYAIQVDAKNGKVLVVDDLDNEFVFDSKNTHLWMKNADGTLVELNKKNVKAYAPDSMHLEAVNSIYHKTNDYKIECQTYALTCQTYKMECATGTVEGVMTFKSPVTFEQQVTANGITSSAPIVGPSDTI